MVQPSASLPGRCTPDVLQQHIGHVALGEAQDILVIIHLILNALNPVLHVSEGQGLRPHDGLHLLVDVLQGHNTCSAGEGWQPFTTSGRSSQNCRTAAKVCGTATIFGGCDPNACPPGVLLRGGGGGRGFLPLLPPPPRPGDRSATARSCPPPPNRLYRQHNALATAFVNCLEPPAPSSAALRSIAHEDGVPTCITAVYGPRQNAEV